MSALKHALREPLLQFFLIGGLLFALDACLRPPPLELIELPPGLSAEQQQQYVDGQILLREARKLGLDRGDSIIQRQLQQKMRAWIEARASREEPDDATLQHWLSTHADQYRSAERIDLEQLFVPRSERANSPALTQELSTLNAGQASRLPISQLKAISHAELRKRYGQALADAAFAATTQWSGPVDSGLGQHLLRISQRHAGELPTLEQLRPQLIQDWRSAQRELAYRQQLEQLRKHYRLVPVQP